ncbi:MAG: hypothetical protein ACJ8F7_03640 [Gemmataceae bacterium]
MSAHTLLAAISERWNDFYVLFGFWSGIASLLGLALAIYQIWQARKQLRQAQTAAEAAQRAAERTLSETRRSLQRYLAAQVHRQLNELRRFVDNEHWSLAELRANDLADHLAQLVQADASLDIHVDQLRAFGIEFSAQAKNSNRKFSITKWNQLVQETLRRIDRLHVPFAEVVEESDDD